MKDPRAHLHDLEQAMREDFPGFRVAFKTDSRVQKLIGQALSPLGNRRYCTDYITVIGRTVWFPTRASYEEHPAGTLATMLHERVHMHDNARHPLFFPTSYLSPSLSSRSWRAHWEQRAYTVDLLIHRRLGRPPELAIARMHRLFCGTDYLRMWSDEGAVEDWARSVLETGAVPEESPFWEDTVRRIEAAW